VAGDRAGYFDALGCSAPPIHFHFAAPAVIGLDDSDPAEQSIELGVGSRARLFFFARD
jgi:hypothetical protein